MENTLLSRLIWNKAPPAADMVPVPLFDRLKTDNIRGVPGTRGVLIYKIREAIQC